MDEADGVVIRAEEETVDEVGDVMDGIAVKEGIGGVGDSRAETAKKLMINVRLIMSQLGLKVSDTTVVGVSDSRAETAIYDGKCEVDNITPVIVGDISVNTTVGEDNDGVAGTTADADAGVRKIEVNDIMGGTVGTTVDETTGVVEEATAGAAAEDGNGEVND